MTEQPLNPAFGVSPSEPPEPAADTTAVAPAPASATALDPAPDPESDAPPVPLLHTEGLSLKAADGPVFADVSLDIWPGRLTVITGPSGTGRSGLLLAITGRLKGLSGHATFDGSTDLIAKPSRVAARTSVARIGGLVELESQLTVGDSIVERALLDGVPADSAERTVRRLARTFDRTFDTHARIAELGRLDQALLALALACVRPAELIVFDDVDRQLATDDQRALYVALGVVAASGPAVVATTVATDSIPSDADVIALPDRTRTTHARKTSKD